MRLVQQAWLLARSDLRQELRQFELVLTAGFFTLVVQKMALPKGSAIFFVIGARTIIHPVRQKYSSADRCTNLNH